MCRAAREQILKQSHTSGVHEHRTEVNAVLIAATADLIPAIRIRTQCVIEIVSLRLLRVAQPPIAIANRSHVNGVAVVAIVKTQQATERPRAFHFDLTSCGEPAGDDCRQRPIVRNTDTG